MPALRNIRLTVEHVEKDLRVRLTAQVILSPLEQCLHKLCPDSFNREYLVHSGIHAVDFGFIQRDVDLIRFPSIALEFEEGQSSRMIEHERVVPLRGELNEDRIPGQADEIAAWMEIRTRLNGAQVSHGDSNYVTGLF